MSAEGDPKAGLKQADFALRRQYINMFRQLNEVGDGVIDRIDVQNGLPCRTTIDVTSRYIPGRTIE